ncbi:Ankyrin repeat domain containing protein [Pandoravirus salinus]|uniref:Ankyrin repeat domain containing protein n=1 Tax=Pandoravirus salinus TaxID=1349410 RepID=S4VU12_9VIRU|nr:ankyrin repeat domain [Pandoravirus salinus]AGO83969.1 Ankyrin repeat domain containing protein [Pandoravirus salinus]
MDLELLRTLLALQAAAGGVSTRASGNDTAAREAKYPTSLLRTARFWAQPRHKEDALIDALRADLGGPTPSPVDAKDAKGRTALFHLTKRRHNRAARFLVERGADPLAEGADGISPLALACLGVGGEEGVGTVALIDAVLAHLKCTGGREADVDRVLNRHVKSDPESRSLLHLALKALPAGRGGLGLLDVVLAHGADPNVPTPTGFTPLHMAIAAGSSAAVLALLRRGALIDAPKADGATPLHFAVLREQPTIVGLLLAHGADPSCRFGTPGMDDVPYWEDKTAAELAFMEDNKLMADAIREWKTLWEPVPLAVDMHIVDGTD